MMRRLLIALFVMAACDKASPTTKPDRKEVGEFPDNPLLAAIPADTPYVFATFKPIAPEYIHKMVDVFGPIWHRSFDAYMAKSPGGEDEAAVFFELLGDVNAKRFDELGLSVTARFAVYGLANGFPVARLEIANGDRLLAFMKQVADRYHTQLPEPTARGTWKLWRQALPEKDLAWIVAVGPKELVMSFEPGNLLDADLATILEERKPATSLTTARCATSPCATASPVRASATPISSASRRSPITIAARIVATPSRSCSPTCRASRSAIAI
jgi:hypothetical protein